MYVIENKGSIERNFEGDSVLQRIIAYAKVRCKYMHYRVFSQKKVVSLDESISEDGKLEKNQGLLVLIILLLQSSII